VSPRFKIGLPLTLHLLAFLLMALKIEPFLTFFYGLAWWSYLATIGAVNSVQGGNSLLFERRPQLVRLALLSVPVWLLFEAYNFRLENWSYLSVPVEPWLRFPGYPIAFATVLPGLVETRTLLANFGFPKQREGRLLRVHRGLLWRLAALGLLMTVLPLAWPRFYFPMVWVGLILLLDPLLYRWRDKGSLLAAAERGDYRETFGWLWTGLVCGVLWEFWNYWAGAKWIYWIPYFDFLRIFEMPLLGYFGFPVFALECYLIIRVFDQLRKRLGPTRMIVLTAGALLFSVAVIYGIEERTILSYKILWGG